MNRRTERPNILLIMDDQHRFDYLGCSGATFINTPNIDRIAERGTRFTHCVTNAPLCAPARIGLASGVQPFRLDSVDNNSILPASTTAYYRRLRDDGYRVGSVGKLDLNKPERYNGRYGDRPCNFQWGFTHPEECEGKMHAGSSATPIGPYTHYLEERGLLQAFHEDYERRITAEWRKGSSHDSVLPADAFEDAYIGARAAGWIDMIPDDFPWHLFVSFVGPHDPYDPPTEYANRYRDATMPDAIAPQPEGKPRSYSSRQAVWDSGEISVMRRQYCAATDLIDHQVGLMLDALGRRGMLENTYILFVSDHGDMLGDHGLYAKKVAYEAALRVPLIVSGPGLPDGAVSGELVELIDLNPTICELAGLRGQEGIDALSLVPLLRGETDTHRADTLSVLRDFKCLRTATHKLIRNHDDGPELYDLQKDPNELRNIAEGNPDLVKILDNRLDERLREGSMTHACLD